MSAEGFRNRAPAIARAVFLFFGTLYLALGIGLGFKGVLFGWAGGCLLVLGLAYALNNARLIGKRPDGSFFPLAVLFHAPFLFASWLGWKARRRNDEPPWNEVAPGLYVGRIGPMGELPLGTKLVVDLTAEMFPPAGLRGAHYRCLPTLDGCASDEAGFAKLSREVAAFEGAPIFVCCAAGHGRSATFAAAVMILRGVAPDALAAELMMKSKRPLIGLGTAQRKLVEKTTAGQLQ